MISSRSQQQQLARLIRNGIQHSRAATRIASDTLVGILTRSQEAAGRDSYIQHGMTRLMREGMQYPRAATRLVASDRLPTCMTKILTPINDTEPAQNRGTAEGQGWIKLWPLNVRGMSALESLDELEQEAVVCEQGILLIQETW